MAKETKIIEVSPSEVNSTMELLATFGWEVISSNTIDTRQTHYVDGDIKEDMFGNVSQKINQKQTGEKYVSITFQRDKSMRNYSTLVELERKYFSLSSQPPAQESPPPKRLSVLLILLTVGSLFITIAEEGFALILVICIIICIIKFIRYPGKYKRWQKENKANANNKTQYEAELKAKQTILAQAEKLS